MVENNQHIGIVKMFNGTFGFINSIDGDIYFHKTGINPSYGDIAVKDKVEYDLEPSSKKIDLFQATNIKFVEKNISEEEINLTYRIGKVSWFDNEKGFGIACEGSQEYFFTRHSIKTKTLKIYENNYVVFDITPSKKKINQFDAINVFILKNYSLTNSLQKLLINELEKLGFVDTNLGYSKLTIISDIYNLYNCAPPIEYIKLNDDFKYQYWLDGYEKQVNLGVVAGKLIEDKNKSNTYYDVFKKIIDKKEQEILLDNILNEMVNLENFDKYKVLEFFFHFTDIDDVVKNDFIKKVASKFDFTDGLDEYKKYQLWLYGYTNIECQEYIVNQIKEYNSIDSSLIFNRIMDEKSQRELLNKIQNEIDFNDYDKYKILTNILKEKNLLSCVKEEFVSNILQTLDNYYSFKLWIDGYTEEIDLGEVSNSLNSFSHSWDTKKTYTEIHSKIFSKIKDEEKQITVLKKSFLKECTNYERFLKLNCLFYDENISENIKEEIKIKFLYNAQVGFKYWLWFNKFSHAFHNKYFKDKTIFYYINDNTRKEIFTEIEIHFNNIINVFDTVNDKLIAEIDEYYRNNWDDFLEDYCEKYLSWLWIFEIQNSSKLFEIYLKIYNGLNIFTLGIKIFEPLCDFPEYSRVWGNIHEKTYLSNYLS
ncbi:MAG: cold shock domain-containing protein, partial [Bacteroidales bacterium]